jgi:hypothetical protein
MKNKQSPLLALLLVLSLKSLANGPNVSLLAHADSLFESRNYTASLRLYDSLFAQHQYAPAMLLKMAYIEEALGHVSMPLYYLSLYHLATGEEAVALKMQDFADKHRLLGYRQSDLDRAGWAYYHYHHRITQLLAALCAFIFSVMLYRRLRKGVKPLPLAFTLLFCLALLFIHIQSSLSSRGIIVTPATVVMAQPSAGSGVLDVLDEGHRLPITGHQDHWVEVDFRGRRGYVNAGRIRPVTL